MSCVCRAQVHGTGKVHISSGKELLEVVTNQLAYFRASALALVAWMTRVY